MDPEVPPLHADPRVGLPPGRRRDGRHLKFAVDQLSDLTLIELPAVGTRLAAGKSFGEVESVKSVSDLYAPVAGEVIEVNDQVTGNVQLLSDDPYGAGWLIKIRVDDPSAVSQLMDHDAYEKKVAEDAH